MVLQPIHEAKGDFAFGDEFGQHLALNMRGRTERGNKLRKRHTDFFRTQCQRLASNDVDSIDQFEELLVGSPSEIRALELHGEEWHGEV